MKKILCMLILLHMAVLQAQEGDRTREIIDAMVQLDDYTTNVEKNLVAIGSSMTGEEFLEKFLEAYSQKDVQENLRNALHAQFTSEELDEIYSFIKSDCYKKYTKEFRNFRIVAEPQMTQILLNTLQLSEEESVENVQENESSNILIGNESNFDAIIKENNTVVVDIYATWCRPCKALAPVFQEVAGEFEGKYVFVKINADENPELVDALKGRALPTLLFYKEGKEVHRQVGFVDKNQLINLMHSYFGEENKN